MAILLYRNYSARMAFCLSFWGTSLRNILMKLLVAGCLRSKRQTTYCAPLSLALYGVDALHVLALRKCAATWLLFSCRNTRISLGARQRGATRRSSHASSGQDQIPGFILQNPPYREFIGIYLDISGSSQINPRNVKVISDKPPLWRILVDKPLVLKISDKPPVCQNFR